MKIIQIVSVLLFCRNANGRKIKQNLLKTVAIWSSKVCGDEINCFPMLSFQRGVLLQQWANTFLLHEDFCIYFLILISNNKIRSNSLHERFFCVLRIHMLLFPNAGVLTSNSDRCVESIPFGFSLFTCIVSWKKERKKAIEKWIVVMPVQPTPVADLGYPRMSISKSTRVTLNAQ